jgi:hypothetical protein
VQTLISAGHGLVKSTRRLAWLAFSLALPLAPNMARADSSSVVYQGRDLGLPLKDTLAQIQATGTTRGGDAVLSITGSGDQLVFTEVNADAVETETTSFKNLDFDDVEVRKIGQADGRYGITLRAAQGTVNDHIVGIGKANTPDRDVALGYMDFWLADPTMGRVKHLADLFATMRARLHESGPTETAQDIPPPAPMIAPTKAVALAPVADAARAADPATPRRPGDETQDAVDEDERPVAAGGKCLFQPPRKPRRAHVRQAAFTWGAVKAGATAGNGRLTYRIAPLHGPDDHQQIAFTFTNLLPVPATLVARVILTSSSGEQQAQNLALPNVAARATKTDESLAIAPFGDASCITDVDVSILRACPLPDDSQAIDDSQAVFNCNADAASGTTTIGNITYVAGREPKNLAAPRDKTTKPVSSGTSATKPITEAANARN